MGPQFVVCNTDVNRNSFKGVSMKLLCNLCDPRFYSGSSG
jgi:hypothetical protein